MTITARHVKSGVLWIAGISLLRDTLQFAVTLVLVRVLDQRTYGVFSLISAVLGLVTVISFHGFLEYTIQARPSEAVDYQTQFTFGGLAQLAAILALNATALGMRRIPEYAPVAPVLSVMSLSFVLEWASELRIRMLERDLNWDRLRRLEAGGLLAGALSAVTLAFRGAGVYALLLPPLVATLPFIYDLFFVLRWRPTWNLDWPAFRPAWRYGLTRMASGLVARGQQVLESAVLAEMIGLSGLGVYNRAVGLASFCCLKLTSLLTLTLFPMVTRFAPNSSQFQRASSLVLRAVAWTSIPTAAILSIVAGQLVHTLYGTKWLATVPLLPWALAATASMALMEACAFLLLANMAPRKTLTVDTLNLIGTAACLAILLPRGLMVYMAGLVSVQIALTIMSVFWLRRSGGLNVNDLGTAFAVPLGAALCLLGAARFVRADSLLRAVSITVGFGCVYSVALFVFRREALFELLRFVPGIRKSNASS